jgi:hypothetical protein
MIQPTAQTGVTAIQLPNLRGGTALVTGSGRGIARAVVDPLIEGPRTAHREPNTCSSGPAPRMSLGEDCLMSIMRLKLSQEAEYKHQQDGIWPEMWRPS